MSPHSGLYQYANIQDAINNQAIGITNFIKKYGGELLLLPHVLSPNYYDNDLSYMREIYLKIPEKYRERVCIVDTDPGFIGLKNEIMKCDFVIAARMHCAVNAISVGVPSLFLSYSEKSKGMSKIVYNTDAPVISLMDFENTSLLTVLLHNWEYNMNIEQIRSFDFTNIFC